MFRRLLVEFNSDFTYTVAMSDTWNLQPLAKGDDDPQLATSQKEAQNAVATFAKKWRVRPEYCQDSDVLLEALGDYQDLMTSHGLNSRAAYYFSLRTAQDQLDTNLKGLTSLADEVSTHLANDLQFFTIQLSKIDTESQAKHLADPKLKDYRHFLSRLFAEGQYTLSDEQEKILNLSAATSYEAWVRMTSTFLAKDQVETLQEDGSQSVKSLPELLSLTNSPNKKVRDQAAGHVHSLTAQYAPVAAEEMNALLSYKKMTDELRGFDRPDASRHLADDIDSKVVDAMLQAVEQQFSLAQRFYALKATLLGQKKLAYHERNIEYGHINGEFSFDQSLKLVDRVFQNLDPQFAEILQKFQNAGQFDVHPRPGKSGGAFCAHMLITQPTYVLLNHTNRLQDVLTLAHEMGHAINNELMRQSQTALNFHTPLSTAEVASTFMEDFVLEHLAQQAEPEAQLAIVMMKLNDDISSIFRQVAAYRFEQDLHQQFRQSNYLPQDAIGELFSTHMASYMGPSVEQSSGSQNWWVYWSHFRNFFYVYSYASGLLISKSLQQMVRQDPKSIKQVKHFLAAGSSAAPADIFKQLGIDITQASFWQLGLKNVEDLLNQAELLAKAAKGT